MHVNHLFFFNMFFLTRASMAQDAAALAAAQHVSSMSNSLIPLKLISVERHQTADGVHDLTITIGRDGLAPTKWNAQVKQQSNGGFTVVSAVAA